MRTLKFFVRRDPLFTAHMIGALYGAASCGHKLAGEEFNMCNTRNEEDLNFLDKYVIPAMSPWVFMGSTATVILGAGFPPVWMAFVVYDVRSVLIQVSDTMRSKKK